MHFFFLTFYDKIIFKYDFPFKIGTRLFVILVQHQRTQHQLSQFDYFCNPFYDLS